MPRGVDRLDDAKIQGRLWTPAQHRGAGPKLWLDSRDLSTLTLDSSRGVSEWRDKSGLGNHASQGTAATRPLHGVSRWKGGASIESVSDDVLDGSVSISTTTLSIYVAMMAASSIDAWARAISLGISSAGDDGNNGYIGLVREGANQNLVIVRNFDASSPIALPSYGTHWIGGAEFDGSNRRMLMNGSVGANVANTAAFAITHYRVFGYLSNATIVNWVGDAGEIILDTATPNTPRRQKYEGYLAWKWGTVGSLAASHPYKNRPPLIGA